MKILQINSLCGIGSTGRIATNLHAILMAQGHKSMIAFGRDTAKNCDHVIHIGNRIDKYLHVARTRFFDAHGFGSAIATKRLIANIQVLNPDIIHLHNLHGYYLHIGVLFEYLKHVNKPIIWTLHDCWAFTGHCSHFDFVGCERWKSECYECPSKLGYPKSIFCDHSQWNYNKKKDLFTGVPGLEIVAPSKWLANLIKQSFLKDYHVEVIKNGIDVSEFRPTSSAFRRRHKLEGKFIILGVASAFVERKGYRYFIDLAKQLHQDEKIILVGVTRKQMENLPPGILGINKTNSACELAEVYSAADLFVNLTLEEVLGLVNLEALACGTPVVTFNSGGSAECLDTNCGLVVERGDLGGLVSAIATVKTKGKDWYTAYCQQHVKKWFDKNVLLKNYLDLYESCLQQTNKVGRLR